MEGTLYATRLPVGCVPPPPSSSRQSSAAHTSSPAALGKLQGLPQGGCTTQGTNTPRMQPIALTSPVARAGEKKRYTPTDAIG